LNVAIDREHLRDALLTAAQASNNPAIEVDAVKDKQRNPDWLRLLSGRALTASEVENGMAIPRRLSIIGDDVELTNMTSWLREHRGATLLLRADAGEGKSTYLRLLANVLRSSAIVLRWLPGREFSVDDALSIAYTTRSLLGPDSPSSNIESLPIVILTELHPVLDNAAAEAVLAALNEHELRGDEVIFLIAGRSSAINSLVPQPAGAIPCSLAPINEVDILLLCSHLQQAYVHISNTMSQENITRLFPNLITFLQLSPAEQVHYFLPTKQPLIVGFLKGNLRQRLCSTPS
jgi:hypothetical protein